MGVRIGGADALENSCKIDDFFLITTLLRRFDQFDILQWQTNPLSTKILVEFGSGRYEYLIRQSTGAPLLRVNDLSI